MSTWNLKELRELSAPLLDEDERKRLVVFTNSFHWKSVSVQYHIDQAKDAVSKYNAANEMEIAKLILSSDEPAREFYTARRYKEMNLVAATSTAHTLLDVLSQILSLLIVRENLGIHEVTPKLVRSKLIEPTIQDEFDNLVTSEEYIYIDAFTNTVKHIQLVDSSYRVSYEDDFHGLVFKSFEYKKKPFSEKSDKKLVSILHEFRRKCIGFGSKINGHVR